MSLSIYFCFLVFNIFYNLNTNCPSYEHAIFKRSQVNIAVGELLNRILMSHDWG